MKMWKTTHLVLMLSQMNAQSKPDNQGSQRKIPHRSPFAVILHNCINDRMTKRLQPHL